MFACGTRSTIPIPLKSAVWKRVTATWQTPPPIPWHILIIDDVDSFHIPALCADIANAVIEGEDLAGSNQLAIQMLYGSMDIGQSCVA